MAKTKEPKKEEKQETQPDLNESPPDLAGDLVRQVLAHGDNRELRLTDALGSLAFAALELYTASKAGAAAVQSSEQPEGDDKSEQA
tara:strand:+ start:62 stop:319 length:258 start_codon:yes stop_codon:yes gene_type:complete